MLQATLFGFSILIAGIISVIRFNKIDRTFFPFILCIWVACINEILSFVLWKTGYHTSINNNIYVLIEALLYIFFFYNLKLFGGFCKLFTLFLVTLILMWMWENLFMGKITSVSSWFRITYSFLIVLMSITVINRLIILDINRSSDSTNKSILLNPILMICVGAIIFFTFKVLVEIFWLYGINYSSTFRIALYSILTYINFSVNLVYALAILWMPPKQRYIML